jgi:ABC transport system ATP-binding/permease protein
MAMRTLGLQNLSFSYGGTNLLEDVTLRIEPGERIGLLGRNGAGKSTLLKLIEGVLLPDAGTIDRAPEMKIARLAQEVPRGEDRTIFDEVAEGLGPQGVLVARIHDLTLRVKAGGGAALQAELDRLQPRLDTETAWIQQQKIEGSIARLGLDATRPFERLSSGMKRRVLLARALVDQPDVLLLDEPTNHLDIESIGWLEDFLLREGITLVFVTHDRMFLQRLATRIVEVERARLFDWTCDYATFQARKAAALDTQLRQEELFDKKLAEEEVWIRKGIEARRTRNQGRLRSLEAMREARRNRRVREGNVRIEAQDIERSGNLVIDARGVDLEFDGRSILNGVTTTIYRGDKIAILGPNGCGKTTLVRTLLGELVPDRGSVRLGTNLQVAYFDQLRARLDEEKTAWENVADGNDQVVVNGKSRHVMGYLRDFLFSTERARSLVRFLSGGERNRLLLAKLMTRPANLLVLDEPTNDLDAETLELLEELLIDYPGTLLVVSHDRAFVNHVATSTLVFEGEGRVREYAGGYDDWVRQKSAAPSTPPEPSPRAETARAPRARPRKLSYHEQRELESLPGWIERLEAEQAALEQRFSEPGFYTQAGVEIAKVTSRLEAVHDELSAAYTRWETLEAI